MPHVRARRKNERPAYAKVRKEHFAEIRMDLLIVFIDRQRNVPEAQPLQKGAFARLKRNE